MASKSGTRVSQSSLSGRCFTYASHLSSNSAMLFTTKLAILLPLVSLSLAGLVPREQEDPECAPYQGGAEWETPINVPLVTDANAATIMWEVPYHLGPHIYRLTAQQTYDRTFFLASSMYYKTQEYSWHQFKFDFLLNNGQTKSYWSAMQGCWKIQQLDMYRGMIKSVSVSARKG
jgi:hypothetical protein